jgi:hypothetical protein
MIFRKISTETARGLLNSLAESIKTDTSGGLCSIDDFIGGGQAFIASENEVDQVVFVIKKVTRQYGRELEVLAAKQLVSGADLTGDILPIIEYEFGFDCDVMTIYTKRAGLVKKLEKAGYAIAAQVMRKNIENEY